MKSLAAIVAALLATVGAAIAGEIVITPKSSDNAVALTISGGRNVDAANVGEIVIKPKASNAAVVLTTSRGKVVKASVRAKPEHMARSP
jgi:hypothetical protein